MSMKVRINISEEGEPEVTLAVGISDILGAIKKSTGFNAYLINPFLNSVFENIRNIIKKDNGIDEKPYRKRRSKR